MWHQYGHESPATIVSAPFWKTLSENLGILLQGFAPNHRPPSQVELGRAALRFGSASQTREADSTRDVLDHLSFVALSTHRKCCKDSIVDA